MKKDVITISSKGQIVIPKEMRDQLSIQPGDKIVAMCDGNTIVLKPIEMPTYEEFLESMHQCQKWAKEVGLTQKDVDDVIKQVRAESGK